MLKTAVKDREFGLKSKEVKSYSSYTKIMICNALVLKNKFFIMNSEVCVRREII